MVMLLRQLAVKGSGSVNSDDGDVIEQSAPVSEPSSQVESSQVASLSVTDDLVFICSNNK